MTHYIGCLIATGASLSSVNNTAGLAFRAAIRSAVLIVCLPVSGIVGADQWAPTRPLRLIVTFAPGGTSDVLARIMAPPLGNALGQHIVVDNRGGAGGIIGTQAIAQAPADGYTFGLLSLSAQAANATLAPKLPYDPVNDFRSLTLVGQSPQVLAVHPSNPAQSLQELFARAKGLSRSVNFATGGIGLGSHIAGELLKLEAKADMVHIPFKGGGPAMAAVMGGEVETLIVPMSTALPFVKSGRLRVLAVASRKRSAHLPDVATVSESGFSGFYFEESWGLVAPAGTPAAAAGRLRTEVVKVLQHPDIAKRLTELAVEITWSTPEQLRSYISGEIGKYRDVIRRAGIKAD